MCYLERLTSIDVCVQFESCFMSLSKVLSIKKFSRAIDAGEPEMNEKQKGTMYFYVHWSPLTPWTFQNDKYTATYICNYNVNIHTILHSGLSFKSSAYLHKGCFFKHE